MVGLPGRGRPVAERNCVVIGGDAAGMSAASQARRRRPADDLAIVAFERGHFTSYSACGIPYWVGGVVEAATSWSPARRRRSATSTRIDARIRHEVVAIDLDRREVVAVALDDGGGEVREPLRPPRVRGRRGAGQAAVGATPTRGRLRRADPRRRRARCTRGWTSSPQPRRAVVVGGGYIGVEMAEAMINRGLAVTLVEQAPQPMSHGGPRHGRAGRRGACAASASTIRTGAGGDRA